MKYLRLLLCFLLVPTLQNVRAAEGDDARVTQQVHDFFQWYCHILEQGKDTNTAKQHRKEISRYVTAGLLAKLVRKPADSQEGDYFVGGLDSDPAWEKNIAVSNVKAGKKNGFTAEVLLTGKEAGNVHARLTLLPEGGAFKIDSVEDIPDFSGMASAQLRAFYEQYLHYLAHAVGDATPMSHEGARDGVTAECLVRAAASGSDRGRLDYFLQSPDWDPDWEQHVEVKAVEINQDGSHGTAEILLTGEKIPKAHLKVSLKHEKDVFKIDEVEKLSD